MVVYICALVVSLFLSSTSQGRRGLQYYEKTRTSSGYKSGFLLVALPFVLLSCLRSYVGTDYAVYTEFYPSYVLVQNKSVEPIFHAVIYLAVKVFDCPHLIVVFFGLLTTPVFFKFIYRYSENLLFSILIFFFSGVFNYSLNIMRQTLAVAIFFFAIQYIERKEWKKYFLLVILCFFIHKTSIVFVALYFLSKLKLKRFALLIIPVISFFVPEGIAKVMELVSARLGIYSGYVSSQYNATPSISLLLINVVAYICGMLYICHEKSCMAYFLTNLQLLALLLCEWMPVIPNGGRIVYMIMPVQAVLVPNSIAKISNPIVRRIVSSVVMLAYCLFFLYYFYFQNYGQTFPFQVIGSSY